MTPRAGRDRLLVFAPLRHRNLRVYFAGQLISWIGAWMQTVGQAWLVLTLTRSAGNVESSCRS